MEEAPVLGPKGKHLLFKKHEGRLKIEPSSATLFKSFFGQLFKIGTVDKKSACSKKNPTDGTLPIRTS